MSVSIVLLELEFKFCELCWFSKKQQFQFQRIETPLYGSFLVNWVEQFWKAQTVFIGVSLKSLQPRDFKAYLLNQEFCFLYLFVVFERSRVDAKSVDILIFIDHTCKFLQYFLVVTTDGECHLGFSHLSGISLDISFAKI